MKKRSEETQKLRAGRSSKAEPNIFAPPQTPFPGARAGQNLISCQEMVTTFTDKPSLVRIDARKQTGPITIHCAAASAQCNYRVQ